MRPPFTANGARLAAVKRLWTLSNAAPMDASVMQMTAGKASRV